MPVASRFARMIRRAFALCASIALVNASFATPGKAEWKVGVSATGPTALDACQNYVLALGASWQLVGMRPNYNSWGSWLGEICLVLFTVNGQVTPIGAGIDCTSGGIFNEFALGGCTTVAPPNPKAGNRQPDCRPDNWSEPGAGNPISVLVGNKSEIAVDFATAGPDVLELRRMYNTFDSTGTQFGRGWRSNFDRRIGFEPGGVRNLVRADGQIARFLFTYVLNDYYDMDLRLAQVGSDFEVTDREGTVETYNSAGVLTAIKTRNGYTQTLSYDGSGRLQTVIDSYGRQIGFTYTADNLVASATAPDGRVVSYTYKNTAAVASAYLLEKAIFPDDTAANPNDNPRVTYHYENADFPYALTGITDERGIRFVTWTYDANGRAIQSERAGGVGRVTITFNVDGTVTETNALGKDTIYSVTTKLLVKKPSTVQGVASANCPAANASYTYDSIGSVTSTTDWNGRVTNYTVTWEGLVTGRTEAFGTGQARTTTTSWDVPKRVPTLISAPRKNTSLTYDAAGLVLTVTETDTTAHSVPYSTNGQTRVWTYTYTTASGVQQLTGIDGPRTDVSDSTAYLYTAAGYLSRVTNAVGHQINVTSHDGMGRPLSVTDANGVVTELEYNARGWLTKSTVKHGSGDAATLIEYSAAGDVTKVTLPDASFLAYTYDDARLLTAIANQIGEKIEFTHDLMGNVTGRVTKDSGGTIKRAETRVYDELGRIIRLIGAATQTTQFAYDLNGNLTALTDALDKATGFGIDALNRTTTATNPLMGVRTTAYDAQDNVTGESDERSIATAYVLNGFGEAIREASPDGGTIVYVRDLAGNVTQKTDARGQVSQYSYDALNRATAATFTGATAFNITYGYDSTAGGNYGIGRPTSFTDIGGTTAVKYDHRGNTVQEDRTIGGTLYTTGYGYDLADNLLTLTYPSGRILAYARDALGRVTAVTTKANSGSSPVDVATSITYMPFGPIASLAHGNALAATFTWDQDYRLTAIKTEQGATKIQDLAYGFNLDDNVTSITDALAAARNQSFTLDDLQRLIAATGIYGTLSYSYDAADNRLTRNLSGGPAETFAYGLTNNRLASAAVTGQPTRTITSDNAGNITLDDRGAGNTVTITITIGADGRPQTVAVAGAGATSVAYKHNALGERVSRVEGATTTHFHYDINGTLIAESDGTGIVIREYLWLGTKPLGLVVGPAGSPTLYFVHADHLDRVQKITDSGQALAWDGQFTPYGRTHAITGTVTNPLRFPGQWADPAAGYFYNYMRDYDPTLARYLSVDPLGTRGGRNKYTYAGANPQNLIDSRGEYTIAIRPTLRFYGDLLQGAERAGRWAGTALGKYLLYELYGATYVEIPAEARAPAWSITVPLPPHILASSSSGGDARNKAASLPSSEAGAKICPPHDPCKGLRNMVKEHERRLKDYKEDPFAHDNKGFLGQGRDDKIISRRIGRLEGQIANFRRLLEQCEKQHGLRD